MGTRVAFFINKHTLYILQSTTRLHCSLEVVPDINEIIERNARNALANNNPTGDLGETIFVQLF